MNAGQVISSLDRWRAEGDPLADEVVRVLAEGREPVTLANVERGARHSQQACVDYLRGCAQIPSWVDWSMVERGRRLFVRTHILSSAALLLGGMIESYTNPHIAAVLTHSGRLVDSARRRVIETGQMVYNTHLPDGLRPWAEGWRTLLQIRLLHAHIRHHLRRTSPAHEVPINQEDSAYTHLMFDVGVAESLGRLGVGWTLEERAHHHHFWRLAGWLLGIDEALLPVAFDDAHELRAAIRARHYEIGPQAIELTHALVQGVERQPPFFLPRSTLYALARTIQGRAIADALELPNDRVQRRLLYRMRAPLAGFSWALQKVTPLERISHEIGQRYGDWIIQRGLEGEPATFQVTQEPRSS